MPKKFKIILDREACIGAMACVAPAPDFWKMNFDDKVDIIRGTSLEGNKFQEIVIEEKDFPKNFESARVCPVTVIHIYDLETGEKLI